MSLRVSFLLIFVRSVSRSIKTNHSGKHLLTLALATANDEFPSIEHRFALSESYFLSLAAWIRRGRRAGPSDLHSVLYCRALIAVDR